MAEPGGESPKSTRDWVKPPVSTIAMPKPLNNNAAQGQGTIDTSISTAVTGAAFPPALRTPGLSRSTKGGEERFSLAPTVTTLTPSILTQARPFSRLMAERITANSWEINISENSVVTVVPRRLAPNTPTFHFPERIAALLPEGAQAGGGNQQSLEWDQFSKALVGAELPTVPNPSAAAFRQDPFSMQSMGTQTSHKGHLTPRRHGTHDAATSPINFLPGAPLPTGTSDPPSKTSAMDFIDQAALRLQDLETFPHLPPLPKTAKELLIDPSDPKTDADDVSEASGVLGDGDNMAHLSERDLCVTGRGKGVAPSGNGGGNGYGNWGGQGRDRNSMYGRRWDVGNRDRWNYDRNRDYTS